jgi:methylase of polypeptide subunit release factors
MGYYRNFELRYLKPTLRGLWPYRRRRFSGIKVTYTRALDGGGTRFGEDYVPYLQNRGMPKLGRVFEWCCGPGFIGFSILGSGLVDTLCLADINPKAVAVCRRTIKTNKLEDRTVTYLSDNLKDIPASEQWDLVVGNPPHYPDIHAGDIRAHDPDWSIHRGFFAKVGAHLKPGGVILLQENSQGSTAETFREMIEQSGLKIIFVEYGPKKRTVTGAIYYLAIMRKDDPVPPWAVGTLTG